MSKELTEFKIALNKLVDDDNMPEVLDLINSERLRLLYILQVRIFDGMMKAENNIEYIWHNTRAAIQKEIKQYESKKPKGYLSICAEAILMQLHTDCEYCYGYRGLDGGKSPENIAAIAELKKHDMIESHRGLMTEDGEVAGSGWCRSYEGNQYIEEFKLYE